MKNLVSVMVEQEILLQKLDFMLLNLGVSPEVLTNQLEDFSEVTDMANFLSYEEVQLKINQKKANKIKKILSAKKRIEEGSYGVCDECGETISHERLTARPFASRCIHCQDEKERSDKKSQTKTFANQYLKIS